VPFLRSSSRKVSEPIIVNGVQCTVEIVMHEKLRRFVSDCAASTVGRLVFVGYLVYLVSMIGYAYGHFPDMIYPFRFYGERELFELLNWPQLALIRSSRFMYRWQASKLTDSLLAVYIALPWWIYGYVFERIVKQIADTSPREVATDRVSADDVEARLLGPATLRDRFSDFSFVRRER
jgi:hypothetical protein